MGFFKLVILVGLMLASVSARADFFFSSNSRVVGVTPYHTTVGTTTALAIPAVSVITNLYGYQICNDAVNTSTYLQVGKATDVSTDGMRLAPGKCLMCENCNSDILKLMKVEGQASDNGYSVIQYKR